MLDVQTTVYQTYIVEAADEESARTEWRAQATMGDAEIESEAVLSQSIENVKPFEEEETDG